jgi:hypothetical protein
MMKHTHGDQILAFLLRSRHSGRKFIRNGRPQKLPHELGLGGGSDKDSDEAACCHCDFRQDTELYGLGPDVDCTKNFKVNADVQSL